MFSSEEVQVILFSFSFIRRYFELVSRFFLKMDKVLNVINICCLILMFAFTCFIKNY